MGDMQPDERPPILPYCRVPIMVRESNAAAPAVARQVADLIAAKRPGAVAEHVGSSAVPGLAGKGTVDLLLPTPPEEIPAVTDDLLELGFQRQQVATAFPPTRPMLQGVIRHGDTSFRVHVHVVPASSPEVTALRGFRDALLADPGLRAEYEELKRSIVGAGTVDSVAFSKAKHAWIVAALERLGLTDAVEEVQQGGLP
ncbi:MAG TPA: GrpB family protein [Actinomycetota bacterium]|nr:GrpB family protein [Actinomycetota bacterium]